MALIGSPSDFQQVVYRRGARSCSECEQSYPAGHVWLVSMRQGRVKKRVCSDECRREFDDRFWQERADEREHRR